MSLMSSLSRLQWQVLAGAAAAGAFISLLSIPSEPILAGLALAVSVSTFYWAVRHLPAPPRPRHSDPG
jgi:hypothetical protein